MSITSRSGLPAANTLSEKANGHRATLPVLLIGTFAIVLDFFIVNVALPAMRTTLRASPSATVWVVAGYGLTFAAGLITAGRLGDRYGRRRTLQQGLVVFTIASLACAAAPTATALVAARLLQGIGAALISPQILATIAVTYTGEQRARALSAYGIAMGLAATVGQIIGGLLIELNLAGLSWRAIFLLNLPIGAIALALTRRHVPESRSEYLPRLDGVGTVLSAGGLAALLLALTDARQQGWPAWSWLALVGSPILGTVFAAHQRRMRAKGGSPLLPPDLLRQRTFSTGLATQLVFWCGQASFFFVLALYLQDGRHLTPLQAGLTFTPVATGFVAASRRAPSLTLRYGRRLIAFGASSVAAGNVLLLSAVESGAVHRSIAPLIPGLLLVGAGQGLCITPITTIVLSHLDPRRSGSASGVLSTTQQLGNSLGVALTGAVFYGTLDRSVATAFGFALAQLTALLLAVALMTRLLPKGPPS